MSRIESERRGIESVLVASPREPVRVACVITRLEGGAGVLALRGAMALDPSDYRVTIVSGPCAARLHDEARAAGIEVVIEPDLCPTISPRRDRRAFRALAALFQSRSFAIVHTNCAKAGAVGRLAARQAGIPYVAHTFHGFPFHQFQSPLRRAAYIAIERRLGRITDLALAVGAGVAAEAVARRLISPERIRTIRVVVDDAGSGAAGSAADPAARASARAALGLSRDALVVGAVGRLTFQKAPETFADALVRLGRPDVIGVWIGDGDLARQMSRKARDLRGATLHLAGERADVATLLPALDVFVLPSRYEGMPTAVVEAMVAGVPVVATAVNAVADVVVPGETGLLVPPERPDLLARSVRYLLDHPQDAVRMATSARALIDERFRSAALARSLAASYSALINSSRIRMSLT
jgi:glycosyltransferase involved in cell wall biosynthesis